MTSANDAAAAVPVVVVSHDSQRATKTNATSTAPNSVDSAETDAALTRDFVLPYFDENSPDVPETNFSAMFRHFVRLPIV